MKKLFLVDVSSLFFRAFYAIRPLSSPTGLPTNAIYGFLSMVLKLIREEKPEYLVFCFDVKEPSFRKEIYTDYKANRTEMPEELIPQIPYMKKVGELLGICCFEKIGYEADDIIGTLAIWGRKQDLEVVIVSGDKDFGQLVDDKTIIYDTMKGVRYDTKEVFNKWGVRPNQIIDYLSLIGDASDNIPGVRGIGPKTAEKLLADHQTLDAIYSQISQISSASLKEKLINGKESAFLSQKLVELFLQVPISPELSQMKFGPVKVEELNQLLKELNFKNLDKAVAEVVRLNSSEGIPAPKISKELHKMDSPPVEETAKVQTHSTNFEFQEVTATEINRFLKKGIETWGIQTNHGILLAIEPPQAKAEKTQILKIAGEAKDFTEIFDRLELKWKGYDLKSFWHIFSLSKPAAIWDAKIAAYVIHPGENLEFSAVYQKYLHQDCDELGDFFRSVEMHVELEKKLVPKLKQTSAGKLLHEMELPLTGILYQMEKVGIKIDLEILKNLSVELAKLVKSAEEEIFKLSGENFNVSSPKQLGHVLFEKLMLPPGKRTKTGYSTDSDVLEKLKATHPIVDHILQYRELTKLKSTYVDSLPNLVKSDGRIHSTFSQTVTTTGRLSSFEPNLQNIPIRTERGARVRSAFIAEKNKCLMSLDYSQIELRILAHYSADKNLCRAFEQNLDIHAATASEVFQVQLEQVNAEMRRTAKAINFGIAYGQGAFGLAENLGVSRKEAQEIIRKYFEKFPGVQSYIQDMVARAQKDGFVETLFGRRRYLDELKSQNPAIRKFGERAAINAPIQGTASDIVKLAMVRLADEVPLPMILQVHDELIFEGTKEELEQHQSKVISIMEGAGKLQVPLKVNSKVGLNWDQAH